MRMKAPPTPTPTGFTPSDYIDSQTALYAVAACLIVLNPPSISHRLVISLG